MLHVDGVSQCISKPGAKVLHPLIQISLALQSVIGLPPVVDDIVNVESDGWADLVAQRLATRDLSNSPGIDPTH